jgi:hypothetical protein
MTVAISTENPQSGWLKIRILGNAVAAGLVGEVANPEGQLLQICEGYLHIITPSTAASTFNFGVAATGVDNADLMSAYAMNAAANTVAKVVGTDLASEGAATTPRGLLWPATSFLTITSAANASTDLVADLYIRYIRLSAA